MNKKSCVLFLFLFLFKFLIYSYSIEPTGKALLTGKFPGTQTFNVSISVPNLVSKEVEIYYTILRNGNFSLSIPLFNSTYGSLKINGEEYGYFYLSLDKTNKVELLLNDINEIQIGIEKDYRITPEDGYKISGMFLELVQNVSDPHSFNGLRFDILPEEYKESVIQYMEKQFSNIVESKSLSDHLKQFLYTQIQRYIFVTYLFNYENTVRHLYEKQQSEGGINNVFFTPIKPEKEYYSFLRSFDWSIPLILYAFNYPSIYQCILEDKILNIPDIYNQALSDWLKIAKITMDQLISKDAGIFYEMLTLYAYMKQLETTPLSEKQIEEIKSYFENSSFIEYLLEANELTIGKIQIPSVVKNTPDVSKEKLMEAIISRYKGKTVIVDFWATWCAPCLKAMRKFNKEKRDLQNKDVIFVYIADISSPKSLWKEKAAGISGDHYYLNPDEWKYLKESFNFDGIPSYLIYDANGVLKNKVTAYPGTEKMKKMIEEVLP